MTQLHVLLPAYNEEAALNTLIPEFHALGLDLRVIVVNDGSSDRTSAVAHEHGAHVIEHPSNKGLGGAIRTLLDHVITTIPRGDILITMDGDGTMPPTLVPRMVDRIHQGADMVIASRFVGGKEIGVPLARKVFSRGARALFTVFTPVRGVTDYTCGYRVMRADLVHDLAAVKPEYFEGQGFTAGTEMLLNFSLIRPDLRVHEIPLELRYDLKQGDSKMNVSRTVRQYIGLISRARRARRA